MHIKKLEKFRREPNQIPDKFFTYPKVHTVLPWVNKYFKFWYGVNGIALYGQNNGYMKNVRKISQIVPWILTNGLWREITCGETCTRSYMDSVEINFSRPNGSPQRGWVPLVFREESKNATNFLKQSSSFWEIRDWVIGAKVSKSALLFIGQFANFYCL